ncbi:MAG: hypothetical protein NTU93_09990 [Arthrobacter sp.]|nr:hypothetical protein [Arthrobacter sp.]
MAEKPRRQPTDRSPSRRGTGKRAPGPAPAASHQGDQEQDPLIAFVHWHREYGILPDVVPVLEQLTRFFPIYAEISGGAAVTAMDSGLIAEFVDALNEHDAEIASIFCASLFEYMHFLKDTGRWTGTDGSHQVLHDVLYHGVLNEKFFAAGRPRKRADNGHQVPRNSA